MPDFRVEDVANLRIETACGLSLKPDAQIGQNHTVQTIGQDKQLSTICRSKFAHTTDDGNSSPARRSTETGEDQTQVNLPVLENSSPARRLTEAEEDRPQVGLPVHEYSLPARRSTDTEAKLEVSILMGEYKQVFQMDGHLRTMKGEPMQIHMKQNANITVMNVHTPRKTPLAYLDAAKKKIDEDVKLGIIKKVDKYQFASCQIRWLHR